MGRVIAGAYRLDAPLGSGAMGTIYRATQLSLGKTIVIKLLHRHLLGDPTISKRFHREAKAASLLNHPNCIQVIDFGQDEDGTLYIAMEYIEGRDLAEVIYEDFPIDPRRIVNILKQTLMALDEAHANGVLHRDLKPENIMLMDRRNQKDFVKVLDFGIAKLQESSPAGPGTFQTVAGVVCGTPEYMSPEQARGEKLDGRSDLYSIGIILYQMLTSEVPFEADSALGVVTKHLSEEPTPPSHRFPPTNRSLEQLCLSLMAKKRERRPGSCLDVVAELERCEREIEASVHKSPEESDRTVVEIKPIQLQELEQARAAYEARKAAAAAQSGGADAAFADTIPENSPKMANAAAQVVAAAAAARPPQRSTELTGEKKPSQPRIRENPGSAKMWIITAVVAVVVAIIGWVVYQAVASKPADVDVAPQVLEAPLDKG